ncbi:hypothetical protein Gorai_022628 [Gossypium raimondii]|uniref:DUF4283 domain-containing protein n=1 Tax=Gossypium raimondii TaxID=29730 RepID=A0A7J8NTS0_GOSRA|nr:hypothetical protein [Gossypium raimondii]
MATTVVVKLLGRNIGYNTFQNKIYNLWRLATPFKLMDVEHGYFLVKFQSNEDFEKVPPKGHGLPSLPDFPYKKKILEEIGGLIGRLAKLDYNTDSKSRGRFARMTDYINLDKALILNIMVNGFIQRVEYEALPLICFGYGRYDHLKNICPHSVSNLDQPREKEVPPVVSVEGKEEEVFGSWMVVERKSRKLSTDQRESKAKKSGTGFTGNFFPKRGIHYGSSGVGSESVKRPWGPPANVLNGSFSEDSRPSPRDQSAAKEINGPNNNSFPASLGSPSPGVNKINPEAEPTSKSLEISTNLDSFNSQFGTTSHINPTFEGPTETKGTRELKDVARDPRVLLLGAEGTSTEPVGGRGGRFKVAGNSRVPLVDAMNPMAELICDQIGSSFGTDAANTVSDSRKDLENP